MHTEKAERSSEGDPSAWNERQLEHSVEFVVGMLEQAGRGQHVAWALGNAMASIANRRGGPITVEQANRLKSAANRAEQGAIRHLGRYFQPSQIATGMRALAIQIDRWSSQEHPAEDSKDAPLYARIFRNGLHTLDLHFQLDERSAKRQAERGARYSAIISELLHSASVPLSDSSRGLH